MLASSTPTSLGVLEVDPRVGQVRAGREGPQRHGLLRVARPDDAHGLGPLACRAAARGGRRGCVKIGSARSGRVLISRRNSSGEMASTRPDRLTRALSQARCPVSRLSSPRNRPTPWVAMTTSAVGVGSDDLGLALEHHDEVVGVVAGPEQHLAGVDRALGAERSPARRWWPRRAWWPTGRARWDRSQSLMMRAGELGPVAALGPKRSTRMRSTGTSSPTSRRLAASANPAEPQT